jgi:hypothetical protein
MAQPFARIHVSWIGCKANFCNRQLPVKVSLSGDRRVHPSSHVRKKFCAVAADAIGRVAPPIA